MGEHRDIWAAVVGVAMLAWLIGELLLGCAPAMDHAPTVLTVASYEHALDDCRKQAKADGGMPAYDACEAAVTRGLCVSKPSELASWAPCVGVADAGDR